ncbi:MAG: glycoside hydrolase family 1 protein [Lachnospiraceae bacterium]|jgi:beta-glucosidase
MAAPAFFIGAATAAHQVEGNNIHSDCWVLEQQKHTSYTEPSGSACDHYHRYAEDIEAMANAGYSAYRFSIEWARIEPEEGKFDEKEVEHYRSVIRCCREHGLEPVVTLHHFTSPAWTIAKGGWESEEIVPLFARYADFICKELGEDLHWICTINEANMRRQLMAIMESYRTRMIAAQKNNIQVGMNFAKMQEFQKIAAKENQEAFHLPDGMGVHNFVSPCTEEGDLIVMKAHRAAKEAIKKRFPDMQVGLTLSLHDVQALPGAEKQAGARWHDEFGRYLPYIADDDFLGVQNYTREVMGENGVVPVDESRGVTQMGYEIYPEGLEHVIRKVCESFRGQILVTENGIAIDDDSVRQTFIRRALAGVKNCVDDHLPVKGYFYWSLLDNFEWQKGFAMHFGLIAVDREHDMKRTPKPSFAMLGDIGRKLR